MRPSKLFLILTGIAFFQVSPAYAKLENFQPADVVLGQPDFTSGTANNSGISARTLNASEGVCSDGKRLFVSDRSNNRILIYQTIPHSNFASADNVLGQPDFSQNTANNGGRGAATLNSPRQIFCDGKRLFVMEFSNQRLLIWNSIPEKNFTAADVVIGQPDFTQATANNGGVSAKSLSNARGGFSDGKSLSLRIKATTGS